MLDGADAVAAVPASDAADAAPDDVPGAHARADRHLAGVRPDLRHEPGHSGQDHADPGVPVYDRVPGLDYGIGAAISFLLFLIIVLARRCCSGGVRRRTGEERDADACAGRRYCASRGGAGHRLRRR